MVTKWAPGTLYGAPYAGPEAEVDLGFDSEGNRFVSASLPMDASNSTRLAFKDPAFLRSLALDFLVAANYLEGAE